MSKLKAKKKAKWIIIVVFVLLFILSIFLIDGINNSIRIIAQSRVQEEAVRIINEGVNRAIKENQEEILLCDKDESGNIKYVSVNSAVVNSIAIDATDWINDEIAKMSYDGIKIPIGNLFESPYTVGWGPDITVKAMQSGSVSYEYDTRINEAGINQTSFSMYIIYKVPVLFYSGFVREDVNVEVAVPIYDVVIVGDVPDTYAKLSNAADFLNLAP